MNIVSRGGSLGVCMDVLDGLWVMPQWRVTKSRRLCVQTHHIDEVLCRQGGESHQ